MNALGHISVSTCSSADAAHWVYLQQLLLIVSYLNRLTLDTHTRPLAGRALNFLAPARHLPTSGANGHTKEEKGDSTSSNAFSANNKKTTMSATTVEVGVHNRCFGPCTPDRTQTRRPPFDEESLCALFLATPSSFVFSRIIAAVARFIASLGIASSGQISHPSRASACFATRSSSSWTR